MLRLRLFLLLLCIWGLVPQLRAQLRLHATPLELPPALPTPTHEAHFGPWYSWGIPAGLVIGGSVLLNRLDWFTLNKEIRERWRYREYRARYVDDVLQFVPMAGAVALDMSQLVRKREWLPLVESASSIALMVGLVHSIKAMGIELRPDHSTWNSFPSGHTATAFVGAELLRQRLGAEYWYLSALGYVAATGTAYLRIYHNRHWLGDTLAGAGIGILSAWIGRGVTRKVLSER